MRWVVVLASVALLGCASWAQRAPVEIRVARAGRSASSAVPAHHEATFVQGVSAIRARQYTRARAIFEELAGRCAPLDDYCLHYLALSHARSGHPRLALSLWQRLSASYPRSVLLPEALLEQGTLLRARGHLATARAALEKARKLGKDAVRTRAEFELAELDVDDGKIGEAHSRFMRVRHHAVGTGVGRDAARRIAELRRQDPDLVPDTRKRIEELSLTRREGNAQNALAEAARLLRVVPRRLRPQVRRQQAEAELALGRFERGLSILAGIARRYPRSAQAPTALFRRSRLLWNRHRDQEARRGFRKILRRYPRDASAPDALYAIARIAESAGRLERAIRDYTRLQRSYRRSRRAREARWRVGWLHYRRRHWKEAAAAFARAGGQGRTTRPESLYWRARALEHAGSRRTARSLYRRLAEESDGDYYAALAEKRLPRTAAKPAAAPTAATSPRMPAPPSAVAGSFHVRRVLALHRAGLDHLARVELRALQHSFRLRPGLRRFLTAAYLATGAYREAIRLQGRDDQPSEQVLYPLAYRESVYSESRRNGLDPLLVLALMRQESLFDAAAHSSAGAIGLMQMLPSTAAATARRLGRDPPTVHDLESSDLNIRLGIAHLAELRRLYRGNLARMLAAYNAGKTAVGRWEKRFGRLPDDEWVESITYRETRNYVKRVLGHYRRYRRIYGGRARGGWIRKLRRSRSAFDSTATDCYPQDNSSAHARARFNSATRPTDREATKCVSFSLNINVRKSQRIADDRATPSSRLRTTSVLRPRIWL